MAVIRPIPKKLLIHEVMLHKKVSEDCWGKEARDIGRILNRVRLEPSSKIVRDKNGAEVQLAAVLYYDCRSSRPSGISFREDDIIIFNGLEFEVKTIESLYDELKIHHYEMGLIKHA